MTAETRYARAGELRITYKKVVPGEWQLFSLAEWKGKWHHDSPGRTLT